MDVLDEDIIKLWRLLHENDVKYILIGGFATNLHGFNRMTADVDIWLKDTLENRKKLRAVINQLDLGDFEGLESMQLIPGWSSFVLSSGLELDIMTSLKGFEASDFDECFDLSVTAIIENIPVRFLSLNHLIKAKKEVFREKDKIDLLELEKIKKASEK
ncbi:hypothetical protein BH10BAC1_BH10BAC1_15190 [soil metagenome]